MLYQTERLEQLELLERQYLAEDSEPRRAGGFHTPLCSVASLSCGQRPHFAGAKTTTLPRPPLCGWRLLAPSLILNRKVHRLWRWTFLFGRGRRIRTRDPRFWSGSEVVQPLENPWFFACFNAFFSQDRMSRLFLKIIDAFLMI